LHRIEVERLEFLAVVELRAHRIASRMPLVQDLQVQLIRPPIVIRSAGVRLRGERARAFAAHDVTCIVGIWLSGSVWVAAWRSCGPGARVLTLAMRTGTWPCTAGNGPSRRPRPRQSRSRGRRAP